MNCATFIAYLILLSAVSFGKPLSQPEASRVLSEEKEKIRKSITDPILPTRRPPPVQTDHHASKFDREIPIAELDLGEKKMPFAIVVKGSPTDRLPLFICMHGGGSDPGQQGAHTWAVNSREFKTQIKLALTLYQPEGIYFVPRMADDRLGRWWHKHNQKAFDRIIDHAISHWNVDPNRIYLLGISEGGYGTDILAPFMADRWAGANAMAAGVGLGNPPANLRNVAFRTDVGEKDMMFDRKDMALAYHEELARLHALDSKGYHHSINLQPGRGHGIDYSQGIRWIVKHTRNPWPEKFTWINQPLDGMRRERFYWLAMPSLPNTGEFRVDASADRSRNIIRIDTVSLSLQNQDSNRTHGKDNVAEGQKDPLIDAKIDVLLSDKLVDLDQPVTIICNGKTVFSDKAERSAAVITEEFEKRPDISACPTARVTILTK